MSETSSARIAIVDDPSFDAHRAPGPHPERPERLRAARIGLYAAVAEDRRLLVEARPATRAELTRVHDARYLGALDEALAAGSGHLDPDTFFSPGSRDAVLRAAGGAVELVRALLDGRASRGIALLRPPGHHAVPLSSDGLLHAEQHRGRAAAAALAHGATRVAIVDWDVHHGNGTQAMFEADPRVLFVSLHQWPLYPGTGRPDEVGRGAGRGTVANVAMPPGTGDEAYGLAFRKVVLPLLATFAPDIVLVSAGFDAHARDPIGGLELDTACFAAMAASLADASDARGPRPPRALSRGRLRPGRARTERGRRRPSSSGERVALPEGSPRTRERAAIERTLAALRNVRS